MWVFTYLSGHHLICNCSWWLPGWWLPHPHPHHRNDRAPGNCCWGPSGVVFPSSSSAGTLCGWKLADVPPLSAEAAVSGVVHERYSPKKHQQRAFASQQKQKILRITTTKSYKTCCNSAPKLLTLNISWLVLRSVKLGDLPGTTYSVCVLTVDT